MARACQQQLITYLANGRRQTDIRILAAVVTTKTDAVVSKGANFSIAAVPFSKGTSTTSFSLKVIHEFACWLCGTWGHVSQSPFSLLLLCAVFCDFFRHTVDIQTPPPSSYSTKKLRMTDGPPKFLSTSNKASTRTSLIRGGSFQVLLPDSWVAESAHSVSRRYYSLISCLAWFCSS